MTLKFTQLLILILFTYLLTFFFVSFFFVKLNYRYQKNKKYEDIVKYHYKKYKIKLIIGSLLNDKYYSLSFDDYENLKSFLEVVKKENIEFSNLYFVNKFNTRQLLYLEVMHYISEIYYLSKKIDSNHSFDINIEKRLNKANFLNNNLESLFNWSLINKNRYLKSIKSRKVFSRFYRLKNFLMYFSYMFY